MQRNTAKIHYTTDISIYRARDNFTLASEYKHVQIMDPKVKTIHISTHFNMAYTP